MSKIIVEIDGLGAEIDADLADKDIEQIINTVRAARTSQHLEPLMDSEREPDYNSLYGEES